MRSFLYFLARILGDLNAVRRNRVPQRLARRAAGWAVGRTLFRMF